MLPTRKSGAAKLSHRRAGYRRDASAAGPGAQAAPEGSARRRRREAAVPQDEAIYTCECGFVFHADVSTSVGCPHCGGTQAW
ncbi:MAG: hypothetical protein ACLP50_04410 [Solirubrobacteraceae bacterium]